MAIAIEIVPFEGRVEISETEVEVHERGPAKIEVTKGREIVWRMAILYFFEPLVNNDDQVDKFVHRLVDFDSFLDDFDSRNRVE